MPSSKVKTSTGTIEFHYTISTPFKCDAKVVEKDLPTLLFLHGVYVTSVSWRDQFDSSLRRFNLVAVDMRGHGATGGKVPDTYSKVEAADDIARFMNSIQLPTCHIVGVDIGADIALQMAMDQLSKVASLILMSPLWEKEPEDITAGRQEVADYWIEGSLNKDDLACADAIYGVLQYNYNNADTPFIRSITASHYPQVLKNWSGKGAEDFVAITVKYFVNNRAVRTTSDFAKINCPVLIMAPVDELTPEAIAEDLQRGLHAAGVQVQLLKMWDAPHYGQVTHPSMYSRAIDKFMITNFCPDGAPSVPKNTATAWDAHLRKLGWHPSDEDSDDEN
ncbi:Alpha/Beta hydrolase protein [Flagelloscypha sp. PMI_526]|nr:Alpha/Beta hydrolase protein [Flagelloscypha sp. PMI_526]